MKKKRAASRSHDIVTQSAAHTHTVIQPAAASDTSSHNKILTFPSELVSHTNTEEEISVGAKPGKHVFTFISLMNL